MMKNNDHLRRAKTRYADLLANRATSEAVETPEAGETSGGGDLVDDAQSIREALLRAEKPPHW